MMSYSVLMSVYCKEKPEHLEAAVQSMLEQTVRTDDFVLICDGPLTEGLYAVIDGFCEKYPDLFHVIKLDQNVGLGLALREGVKACRNEYIARMDSDDIALADRIERQIEMFERNGHLSVVGAQIAEFRTLPECIEGYRIVPRSHKDIMKRVKTRNPMNHVTVIMKRSDVLEVGNYQSVIGFEDYHLWIRMLSAGKMFSNIDGVGCYVRTNGMYKRRGGIPYFKNCLQVQRLLLRNRLIGYPRYVINVCVRFFATALCPSFLRKILFQTAMRQKRANNE